MFLQSHFHDRIAQLVYTFPEDAVTSTGSLFWSPPKRFPHPLVFKAVDPGHAAFVQAGAILKAGVHGIAKPDWACDTSQVCTRHPLPVERLLMCQVPNVTPWPLHRQVASVAARVPVPAFAPQKGIQIETDPKATKARSLNDEDDESVIEMLISKLEVNTLLCITHDT